LTVRLGHTPRRVRIMLGIALFVLTLFAAQLIRIQGLDASSLASQALGSRLTTQVLPAPRGQIQDAQGNPLALSVDRRNITVDQTQVANYAPQPAKGSSPASSGSAATTAPDPATTGATGAAKLLAPILDMSVASLTSKLTGTRKFAYVIKDVTPAVWDHVDGLGIPGIYSEQTTQRVYPQGSLAASLVGFMGTQNQQVKGSPQVQSLKPLGGLELQLNSALSGKAGSISYEKALGGQIIATAPVDQVTPVPGENVRLTIDQDIQWKAETLLADQVHKTGALSGTVVVMDVRTGDLLALAAAPTFDPANYGKAKPTALVDQALAGVYEPGSTSKVMTAAAALEEGAVTPTTPVTVPGTLHRSDRTFHDAEAHGTERLTLSGVLAKSSNIGAIKVGEKLSPKVMWSYLTKFGVGQPTGLDFPGESAGILANYKDWNGSQRYTVLFGQGLSVNAVQAAGIFQTIANNGLRMPPRLVDSYVSGSGAQTRTPPSTGVRVISPKVATQLRTMLEGVVSNDGTAPAAKIPGYRVAGKTGTAQRFDPTCGCYRGFTGSFIGMAPADNPQLIVAVTLQRPVKGYYGGAIAAPVFQQIMSYALARLDIPPSGSKSPKVKIYAK
jgi:cell division protein FtsI (penicillin-binding protein 3)